MSGIRVLLAAATLTLFFPVHAAAQACLGNVAGPGQGWASAGASFTDGAWAMGGAVGGNLESPVSLEGAVSHTLYDNTDAAATGLTGTAAAEVGSPESEVSVCPAASLSYRWLSNDAGTGLEADGVVLGGGLGVGTVVQSAESGLRFVPRATGALVHDRFTASFGGVSSTESQTYASFSGQVLLAGESVYAGPSASITTLEGADPVFSLTLGFTY